MQRDNATLLDIAKAARLILLFCQGMDKAVFLDDVKTQSAVLHQIMVLGEAVKRLSKEFRGAHPEVPWSPIARMRDILIHKYDDVDLEEVWKTAQKDVPELLTLLVPLLPEEQS
jgi:uncharacterized protein with HEPN domain